MKYCFRFVPYIFCRYRAVLYPCSDTAAERQEKAIGVNTRIEDIQAVSALFRTQTL